MSTINTILIKRRAADSPLNTTPTLSSGELAYSEKASILYYGSDSGTINIAGSGAYLDLSSSQIVSGPKTFTDSTTLSGLTISSGSVLDFGSNTITNVADPVNAQDVATKQYVLDQTSGNFVEKIESEAVVLNGGLTVSGGLSSDTISTTGNLEVGGKLTVVGDLEILGELTSLETTTTVTSAFSVVNAGTTTALTVEQTGSVDIAEFIDDGSTALIIKDGGNVGIGTDSPNAKLTIAGSVSATSNFTIDGTASLDNGAITTDGSGSITGTSGTSELINFVIDGGTF